MPLAAIMSSNAELTVSDFARPAPCAGFGGAGAIAGADEGGGAGGGDITIVGSRGLVFDSTTTFGASFGGSGRAGSDRVASDFGGSGGGGGAGARGRGRGGFGGGSSGLLRRAVVGPGQSHIDDAAEAGVVVGAEPTATTLGDSAIGASVWGLTSAPSASLGSTFSTGSVSGGSSGIPFGSSGGPPSPPLNSREKIPILETR
ncbi:MAG TPA: hypothetical protein VMJ10_19010 [Kofleriaceae bacterium]|nr:hypothetical protein [Kofleriaceae bacterium]